jgi:hypothetical protein
MGGRKEGRINGRMEDGDVVKDERNVKEGRQEGGGGGGGGKFRKEGGKGGRKRGRNRQWRRGSDRTRIAPCNQCPARVPAPDKKEERGEGINNTDTDTQGLRKEDVKTFNY